LAGLRRYDRRGRARAAELLARAAALAPAEPRLAARDPAAADLVQLGVAAAWLFDGGARRAALSAYQVYVDRGGRAPDHVRRYLALHRWWYGDRERPGALLLDDARRAGADLCAVAGAPDDLGGAAAAARAAASPLGEAAAAVRRRAARLGWRVAEPRQAGTWLALSLGAWARGEVASWTDEVAARLDLAALAAPAALREVPAHAAATVLRAAGHPGEAAAAFDRAVEGAARLPAAARAVLLAEAVEQGRGEGTVDLLLHAGDPSHLAWRVALRGARAADPGGQREASLVEQAPAAAALAHLREAGERGALAARAPSPALAAALARWRGALSGHRLAAGRDALLARWRRLSG